MAVTTAPVPALKLELLAPFICIGSSHACVIVQVVVRYRQIKTTDGPLNLTIGLTIPYVVFLTT